MNNKCEIPLPNGFKLVAETNADPEFGYEMYIGIHDNRGGWWQDIAVVRPRYTYEESGKIKWNSEEFDLLAYTDRDTEDYTHSFVVKLWSGDEGFYDG